MADEAPRRSGRVRKSNPKYSNDGLQQLDDILSSPEPEDTSQDTHSDDTDGFAAGAKGKAAKKTASSPSPSSSSAAEDTDEGDSDQSSDAEDRMSDVAESAAAPKHRGSRVQRQASARTTQMMTPKRTVRFSDSAAKADTTAGEDRLFSQGVYFDKKRFSKNLMLIYSFGEDTEDIDNFMRLRSAMFEEIALPRRSLRLGSETGKASSIWQSEEAYLHEANEGWDWYYNDGGIDAFQKRQKAQTLSHAQAYPYLPPPCSSPIVLPSSSRTNFRHVDCNEAVLLRDLWTPEKDQDTDPEPSATTDQGTFKAERHGWLLQIGEAVAQLAWSPNCTSTQYLAIATRPEAPLGSSDQHPSSVLSAFEPMPPFPTSVQIWGFAAQTCKDAGIDTNASADSVTIDNNIKPSLRLALCFDWGYVRSMEWCPAPREPRPQQESTQTQDLGLLALVTTDGKLRVLRVVINRDITAASEYKQVDSVAFESPAPHTVFTHVTWVGSAVLAASTGNGFVAVFDLESHLCAREEAAGEEPTPEESPPEVFPRIFQPFHFSYIRAISAAYPARPQFVYTTAVDGLTRLTDLREPDSEHAYAKRTRQPASCTAWYDHVLHLLVGDDTYTLRAHSVRRVDNSTLVGRFSAPLRTIATSPIHASVLVGCADGTITAMNPMRRFLQPRIDFPFWQQVWFQHDWRRGLATSGPVAPGAVAAVEAAARPGASFPAAYDPTLPLSRLTTMWLPFDAHAGQLAEDLDDDDDDDADAEEAESSTMSTPRGKAQGKTAQSTPAPSPKASSKDKGTTSEPPAETAEAAQPASEGIAYTAMYERATAVTCAAWCPSRQASGWAAAGTGAGWIVVEDLGVE